MPRNVSASRLFFVYSVFIIMRWNHLSRTAAGHARLIVHYNPPQLDYYYYFLDYSILFFPSSRPSSLASLLPRSCFVPTSAPITGLCDTLDRVSWYDST
jgi:hypothetical protein